jgi:ComF family protein
MINLGKYLFIEECRQCHQFIHEKDEHKAKTLCHICFKQLNQSVPKISHIMLDTERVLPVLSRLPYEGLTKKLIYNCKYDNDRLLIYDFALLMQTAWAELEKLIDTANLFLMPIPLHWSRQFKRGFNQSELLAYAIANFTNKPILKSLKRTRATKAQHTLNAKERFANTYQAFSADKSQTKGKNIVLIDDIFTSGATLISASSTLLEAHANSVIAFTLSRALFK